MGEEWHRTERQTNRQTDRQTDTSADNKGRLELSRAREPTDGTGNKACTNTRLHSIDYTVMQLKTHNINLHKCKLCYHLPD